MATDRDDLALDEAHTSSPTDQILPELRLYGYRPFEDEPDPRPLPEANAVGGAVADIFDALAEQVIRIGLSAANCRPSAATRELTQQMRGAARR